MPPPLWEYQVVPNPTPSQMTALGLQGWELVSVTCIVAGIARSERAYFKRPLAAVPAHSGARSA